ncbi:MAG TPA: cupin domain-containing protein [Streptosporangiaceae bacterium]|jgi:quercetin dioxygenase-like cupin family protein|nr:cupin domain-containing protein [Streptosporangiaceae bacterium]
MTAGAGATVRTVLDTGGGLVRRQVEVPAGAHHNGSAGPGGELCFVIEGAGQLSSVAAPGGPVRPGTGVWLPPGTSYSLTADGPGPMRLDSVLLPAAAPGPGAGPDGAAGPLLADLAEQPAEITGDRQFRVLFAPGQGCAAATQFVGEIPPGRAPFHTHTYDEVVLILAGEGVLHIGGEDRPLAPGSCLHLAPGTPHCLENTGQTTLRVLGVFHPGGSPAAKKPASG